MQTIKPNNAGFRIDKPASPLNTMLQINFKTAAPMMTPNSHFQFLFHGPYHFLLNFGLFPIVVSRGISDADRKAIEKGRINDLFALSFSCFLLFDFRN